MKRSFCTFLSAAIFAGSLVTVSAVSAAPAAPGLFAKNTDVVQVRHRRGHRHGGNVAAGVALGAIGGLALGAAIANDRGYHPYYVRSGRPGYVCDEDGNCYPRRGYRRGWVWDPGCDCWVRPGGYYPY